MYINRIADILAGNVRHWVVGGESRVSCRLGKRFNDVVATDRFQVRFGGGNSCGQLQAWTLRCLTGVLAAVPRSLSYR